MRQHFWTNYFFLYIYVSFEHKIHLFSIFHHDTPIANYLILKNTLAGHSSFTQTNN